jgi:glutathione S-transferase
MPAPNIKLYELGPTRSARVRWALLEAGLAYESVGNRADVIGSDELREIHPLGKLPAAVIDGRPLFESAAIVTAVADLVPESGLIATPGSWSRYLHYQWVSFALTEMEPYLHSTEINSIDFILPKSQHVPPIIEQNAMLYKRAAAALDAVLGKSDYLVDNRFSATDIVVGYTVNWGQELKLLGACPNLQAYLERLLAREHCTLVRY